MEHLTKVQKEKIEDRIASMDTSGLEMKLGYNLC